MVGKSRIAMKIGHLERVLFVNPPYESIGIKEAISTVSVVLGLAMLAGVTQSLGIEAKIIDANLFKDHRNDFEKELESFKPQVVGITFTTPLASIAYEYAGICKRIFGDEVIVVAGGSHATALPDEVLDGGYFDAVLRGEGEIAFADFLTSGSFDGSKGWSFIGGGLKKINEVSNVVDNLDGLPFGAFNLFDVNRYIYPSEAARQNPVCLLETSRGCCARCIFCNKNIFGYKIRCKSPKRIVDEMQFILSQGFREIHLADDSFTASLSHAEDVCEEIIRRGLKFPWVPRSGIRVDRVSSHVFSRMREAGCYHIPFGIESGSQMILDNIQKGTTISQIRDAVNLAKSHGFETTGYFMFGLPGETAETVQKTIDFAVDLNLDHAKFGVAIPLPGTPFFDALLKDGRIKTRDWRKFTYSSLPWDVYDHPTLSRSVLEKLTFAGNKLLDIANVNIHLEK